MRADEPFVYTAELIASPETVIAGVTKLVPKYPVRGRVVPLAPISKLLLLVRQENIILQSLE